MTKFVRLSMLIAAAVALVAVSDASAGIFKKRGKNSSGSCGTTCCNTCNTGCSTCNTGCSTGCSTCGTVNTGCNTCGYTAAPSGCSACGQVSTCNTCNSCNTCGQQVVVSRRQARKTPVSAANCCTPCNSCGNVVVAGGPMTMAGTIVPTAASPMPADKPATATPPATTAPAPVVVAAPMTTGSCATCGTAVASTGCDDCCTHTAPARRRGLFRR